MRIASATMFAITMLAAGGGHAAESYAFGNRVLTVGDSAGKLIELAGSPVHKEPVENKFGAQEAERWEFRRDDKTLFVTIRKGKVAQIDEVY
jgi:hypothetical protein